MAKIKRIHCYGHPYFITNVTYKRKPILVNNIELFWKSIDSVRGRIDFNLIAWVILPDHLHIIIDTKGSGISEILQRIKLSFSSTYRRQHGRSGNVWQHGFWDHIIRNEKDMNNHLNYIHFNPVKHGMTKRPLDYLHSSMVKFKDNYPPDWGVIEMPEFKGDFGE